VQGRASALGRKNSPEHVAHMKIALKGIKRDERTRKHMSETRRGENNPRWCGGISSLPYCPKWTKELKQRIRAFFEYRCICCGKHEDDCTRKHCCHHVEYNKDACCDGKPVHFAAMCTKHHSMTNADRNRWEAMIHRIIDEIYDGKSYYTQEEYKQLMEDQK